MEATTLTRPLTVPRSRRLLASLADDRLVAEARRGSDAAFEAIYERYHRPLTTFCRHMLGSPEDSEDAVQHTFGAAFRALGRTRDQIRLQPWLYTIARNRCISVLRARREQPVEDIEPLPTAGLSEEVERRSDLRELLSDLHEPPERQRAALVLSEAADLGHGEIAQILECERKQVKALIFQARSSLITSRRAREVSCFDIREKLATARGGALRGAVLRRHLRRCPGCTEYAEEVRRQRTLLAIALPVVPSLALRKNAMAAAGATGAGATGAGATGGGGLLSVLGAQAGTKAVAAALALGGAAGGIVAADPELLDKARTALADTVGLGDRGGSDHAIAPGDGAAHGQRVDATLSGAAARPGGPIESGRGDPSAGGARGAPRGGAGGDSASPGQGSAHRPGGGGGDDGSSASAGARGSGASGADSPGGASGSRGTGRSASAPGSRGNSAAAPGRARAAGGNGHGADAVTSTGNPGPGAHGVGRNANGRVHGEAAQAAPPFGRENRALEAIRT